MNQGSAIKKEGDMEQAIVMEITLSSSDLYEDALAALAKLEEEAVNRHRNGTPDRRPKGTPLNDGFWR
jgi:hypothetical protein